MKNKINIHKHPSIDRANAIRLIRVIRSMPAELVCKDDNKLPELLLVRRQYLGNSSYNPRSVYLTASKPVKELSLIIADSLKVEETTHKDLREFELRFDYTPDQKRKGRVTYRFTIENNLASALGIIT